MDTTEDVFDKLVLIIYSAHMGIVSVYLYRPLNLLTATVVTRFGPHSLV